MNKVVACGELLWDLLPTGKVLGGASANFIFRINSFGDEGVLITRIGNDELGREARKIVTGIGLSDEYVQTDPEFPTGTVDVKIDEEGIPDFTIIRDVAYDHIELSSEMIRQVKKADCLYFGTLVQRSETSGNTLHELIRESDHAVRFLDINLRKDCYTTATVRESLSAANILKINDEELLKLKQLLGLHCSELQNMAGELVSIYQLDLVLVTLGAKGAFFVSNKSEVYYSAGYKVELVDTVGSGDAFSAGFVHSYLNGKSRAESLEFGNACGAVVAGTKGGTEPVSKEEIIRFIQQPHERISM